MRINIPRLDKVETGLEPLPSGRYKVKLTHAEKRTTQDGSEYIAWQATVEGGEYEGRKIFWNTSLKENALWNLKGLLEAAKVEFDPEGFNTEDALGKLVELQIDVEEYEGRQVNRVSPNYYPAEEV